MRNEATDSIGERLPIANSVGDGAAILLIDVITDFEFDDGDRLFENARRVAPAIADLRSRAGAAGLPVIYVNDNYGKWQDDLEKQVIRIIESSRRGKEIVEQLRPAKDDYYVLKPQRSAFYETPLAVLLASMNVSNLVIAGFTTDICVLFSAHDAYMRGFRVFVPSDCSAAAYPEYHDAALQLIARVADVDTTPSTKLDLAEFGREKSSARPDSRADTKSADGASV